MAALCICRRDASDHEDSCSMMSVVLGDEFDLDEWRQYVCDGFDGERCSAVVYSTLDDYLGRGYALVPLDNRSS
jgi:hypothetical protein